MSKLLSVDSRSIRNWESGDSKPNATALAVMVGFEEYFKKYPGSYRRAEIRDSLEIGGIAYLLIRLLENK